MLNVKAIVEFEYKATVEDELNLKIGDIITNITQVEEGWCRGQLNGNVGMFPDNFVKMIEEKVTTPKPASKEILRVVKVLFPYDPENEDELKLEPGNLVSVIADEEEGWARGILKDKEGVFPTNFTEVQKTSTSVLDNNQDKPSIEPPTSSNNKKGFGNIFDEGPIKLRPTSKTDVDINKMLASDKSPKPTSSTSLLNPIKSEGSPLIKSEVVKEVATAKKFKVVFDYKAENDDELTLTKGQVVNVINMNLPDAGWWMGTISGPDGSVIKGVFPDNFVAPLQAGDEVSLKKSSSNVEVKTIESKPSKPVMEATSGGVAVETKPTAPKTMNQPQSSLSLKRPAPKQAPVPQTTKTQVEKDESIDDVLPVTEDSKLTHFKRPAGPKNRKRPDANNRREKAKEASTAADNEMTSPVHEQEKLPEAGDAVEDVPTSPVGDVASIAPAKRDHKRGGIQVMPMMTTTDASLPAEKPSWMKNLKSRKSDKRPTTATVVNNSCKEEAKPAWLANLAKKRQTPPPTPAAKPLEKVDVEKTRLDSDVSRPVEDESSSHDQRKVPSKPSEVKKTTNNNARPLSMQFLLNPTNKFPDLPSKKTVPVNRPKPPPPTTKPTLTGTKPVGGTLTGMVEDLKEEMKLLREQMNQMLLDISSCKQENQVLSKELQEEKKQRTFLQSEIEKIRKQIKLK